MTLAKTAKCPKCGMPNQWFDAQATGAALRSEREQAGLNCVQVGDAMGISRAYVSALELGDRPWSPKLVEQYRAALATAKQQRGK